MRRNISCQRMTVVRRWTASNLRLWNSMLRNTVIECWNILKYEIENIIDQFVPFARHGDLDINY